MVGGIKEGEVMEGSSAIIRCGVEMLFSEYGYEGD
jgi:hypothetical protein